MAGLKLMRRRREAEQAPMRLSAPVPGYLRVALGIAVALVFIAPVWWVIAASFKPQFAIFRDASPVTVATFLPFDATLDNYREVFGRLGMGRALINSTIVAVSQVILTLVLCSMGAYAFSRLRFPGRRVLFIVILGTLLVPFESILIPMYLMASRLGLGDMLPAVFLPEIASAFGLFLLRQAFDDVPRELDDAALVDGASHFRVFRDVLLPNIKPALATLSVITFLWSWNGFLWPLVIIQRPELQLIQVALAQTVVPGELPNWGAILAGATIATVPVLALFLLLQRYIVQGFTESATKG